MSQMVDIGNLVFAAQMARDSVSLDKGLQKLNKLAESSGLEEVGAWYEEIKTDVETCSDEFMSKKPPRNYEINFFAYCYDY